jgi:methionyl-tRNA formyltransferase
MSNFHSSKTIILASPHYRNNDLMDYVQNYFPDRNVICVSSNEQLNIEYLRKLNPEYIFFPHWSSIIPKEIYSEFNCIIFHMTDLPYGRGGSPLQNLIIRGHKETMLTAIKCVSELDAGPVYLKQPLSLSGSAEQILQRASVVIGQMIVEFLRRQIEPIEQQGEAVYFKRRCPEDGDISNLTSLSNIYDYIRMLDANGYPRAFFKTSHAHIEFMDAEFKDDCIVARVLIRRIDCD